MRPMHGNAIIDAVAHDPSSRAALSQSRNRKDTSKPSNTSSTPTAPSTPPRGAAAADAGEPAELGADSWAGILAPRLAQFAAVARHEHVTRAAHELGMPQPTLSRAIVRLEDDLGIALFARHGRTLSLTPAGRAFLASTERALTDMERATESVRADADPAAGKVAFGFLHTLGPETVPGLIRTFRADHPRIRFQLVQNYGEAMIERLRVGDLDLCLTSPVPDYPDLVARRLDEQKLRLVVPDDHPLARRKRVRLAEAADRAVRHPRTGLRAAPDHRRAVRRGRVHPADRVRGRGGGDAARAGRRGPGRGPAAAARRTAARGRGTDRDGAARGPRDRRGLAGRPSRHTPGDRVQEVPAEPAGAAAAEVTGRDTAPRAGRTAVSAAATHRSPTPAASAGPAAAARPGRPSPVGSSRGRRASRA